MIKEDFFLDLFLTKRVNQYKIINTTSIFNALERKSKKNTRLKMWKGEANAYRFIYFSLLINNSLHNSILSFSTFNVLRSIIGYFLIFVCPSYMLRTVSL